MKNFKNEVKDDGSSDEEHPKDPHCFPVNGRLVNPIVYGGNQAVLDVYRQNIPLIELGDSVLLKPLLEKFYQIVQSRRDMNQYSILLVMVGKTI